MKIKSILLLKTILISIIITSFYSCSKYEEGPAISLRTKTNRISGKWEIKEINKNGILTDIPWFISLRCEINKDGGGEYKILVTSSHYEGNPLIYFTDFIWSFENNKQYIKLIPAEENNKNYKGPEPEEPEDENPVIDISFDENEIIEMFNINKYARIIKLTNSDFWIEELSLENEEPVISIAKFKKIQ